MVGTTGEHALACLGRVALGGVCSCWLLEDVYCRTEAQNELGAVGMASCMVTTSGSGITYFEATYLVKFSSTKQPAAQ